MFFGCTFEKATQISNAKETEFVRKVINCHSELVSESNVGYV